MDKHDYANEFPVPYREDVDSERIVLNIAEFDIDRWMEFNLDPSKDSEKIDSLESIFSSGELIIPAVIQVCPLCNGKGKHVNPSIDSNGISMEEFDEDPDFREQYFSGVYDVSCYRCKGKRVVCEPDRDSIERDPVAKLILSVFDEYMDDECDRIYAAIYAAERAMGA